MKPVVAAIVSTALSLSSLPAQEPTSRPAAADSAFPGSTAHVYARFVDLELRLHVFSPEGHAATDRRPAIVFFFGGGWVGGSPAQFVPQCEHFASRGIVAVSAEYRTRSRGGATPAECVADGIAAVAWLEAHAADLGVDSERIAAGGGSAGGHVAACTALTVTEADEIPAALVLYNPVLDVGSNPQLQGRFGDKWRELSPMHHVRAGLPPTLIMHGTADRVVPFADAERFAEAMRDHGNCCELEGYEDRGHGFFNRRPETMADHKATTERVDAFLTSLGWLAPPEPAGDGKGK